MTSWVRKALSIISHHTQARKTPARYALRAEPLEDRVVPATFTELATQLAIDLNATGESVAVVSSGSSYAMTLTGGTWSGTDSANVAGNGTATLTVSAAGIAVFSTGIDVTDSTPGTGAAFFDSGANAYANPFTVTLDDGSAGVTFSGASDFAGFSLDVASDRTIVLNPGAAVTTTSGAVTLTASKAAAATGTFDGIVLNGASITSVSGGIALDGTGGTVGSHNRGVVLTNAAAVRSTGTATITITGRGAGDTTDNYGIHIRGGSEVTSVAGAVMVAGTGGAGTDFNFGVRVEGAGAAVASADGDIIITGTGGAGSGLGNEGVLVDAGGSVRSTGAAKVTVTGFGGTGMNANRGVRLDGAGSLVTAVDGAVAITGTAGAATGEGNDGILFVGSTVSSTGAAPITITGTGGAGTSFNRGVGVAAGAVVTSAAGDITITGSGGSSSGGANDGVDVFTGGRVSSTGTGPGAARITIVGTSGTGHDNNRGVGIDHAGTVVTAVDGAISITGTGGSTTGVGNHGVGVGVGGRVSSTGTGGDAATVSITGKGGTGSAFNRGVSIEQGTATVTSVGGDITIDGTGSPSSGQFNEGVYIGLSGIVSSTGTGADAATITITGTGGTGTSDNRGVAVELNSAQVTSVTGAITITGTGGIGTGTGNVGVWLFGGGSIRSTGNPVGATITISGTGGTGSSDARGVQLEGTGSVVTTNRGAIVINGTGGTSAGPFNQGVFINFGAGVNSTGSGPNAGTITISGKGGSGVGDNRGVNIEQAGSAVTALDGDIIITGTAGTGGSNVGVLLFAGGRVRSTGGSTDAARISIAGTAEHIGVFVVGAGSALNTQAGDMAITGTSAAGAGVVVIDGGAVSSATAGNIAVTGNGAGTDRGVLIQNASLSSPGAGSVSLVGNSPGGDDVAITDSPVITGPGNLTLTGNEVTLTGTTTLAGSGHLTVRPRTSATTIGLGGGAGALNLDDAELAKLVNGFASITIGAADGTGAVTVDTAAFADPVIFAGSGAVSDATDTGTDVAADGLTLAGPLAPGQSPGVFSVAGGLTLAAGGPLTIEVGGTVAGADYDQVAVAGAVDLNGAVLALSGSHVPAPGNTFTIVDNDGAEPIVGTFAGLPEGTVTTFNGVPVRVSYVGGSGNDVVLAALATVSINDVTQAEGDAGTTAFTFTVTLAVASGDTVTVNYATADGTALAGSDYAAASGMLTFLPGQTTQTLTVLVSGDTTFEPGQTFFVNLSNPVNATIADPQGVGTITNDDAAPTLAIADALATEGGGTLTFTVTRTGATEVPIVVGVATADDTAVSAGGGPGTPDFVATIDTLSFSPSLAAIATRTFTVTITDDTVYEATERFFANLSNPSGATIPTGVETGTGTIVNDDQAPSITLSLSGSPFAENGGMATVTATLSNPSSLPVTVNLALGGTASASDYTASANSIVITAGSLIGSISLTGQDDTADELSETVIVDITGVANGTESGAQQVTAAVADDDLPVATANSYSTSEDRALTVPAPGILGDDGAAPNSTAELVGSGPANGKLTPIANGGFTYTPNANFNGGDSFEYRVNNGTEVSNTVTVTLAVSAVNDVPSFVRGPNQVLPRGAGVQVVPGWATAISPGSADEAGQSLTFLVTTDNPGLFTVPPAIDPATGTLTYTPAQFVYGTATVTVRLRDDSGTANGGADTSAAQAFAITVHKHRTESRDVSQDEVSQFAVAGPGKAVVYNGDGSVASTLAPFADGSGVRAAVADVNGDAIPDTVLVTGPGTPIRVAVVSGADSSLLVAPFDPFGGDFLGGGFVAAGDFDGDGAAEFVVTPDQGGGPRVSIFSLLGGQAALRANFITIEPNFRGGARVGVGDVNADGVPELVVSAGFLGGPRIVVLDGQRVLSVRDFTADSDKLVGDFFAFSELLRNGAYVSVGDVDGDGFGDLVFGAGPGGGPEIRIASGQTLLTAGSAAALSGAIADFFLAGDLNNRGGVRVAVKDADGDARADVVAGTGGGQASFARVYLGRNFTSVAEPGGFQNLDPFGGAVLADGVYVG